MEKALREVLLWDKVKDKLSRRGPELSLEEQQKLCIARLLPVKPDVITSRRQGQVFGAAGVGGEALAGLRVLDGMVLIVLDPQLLHLTVTLNKVKCHKNDPKDGTDRRRKKDDERKSNIAV